MCGGEAPGPLERFLCRSGAGTVCLLSLTGRRACAELEGEEVALKQPPQCWGTGWWASSSVLAAGEGCALAGVSCVPVSPAFCQPRFDGPSFQAKPALLRLS